MKKFERILSDRGDCRITLIHDPDDPSTWIIRQWKSAMIGRRRILSRWFTTREQAERFAQALDKECAGTVRVRR